MDRVSFREYVERTICSKPKHIQDLVRDKVYQVLDSINKDVLSPETVGIIIMITEMEEERNTKGN